LSLRACPKITATVTDTEYWQALMALNTTDAGGKHDVEHHQRSARRGGLVAEDVRGENSPPALVATEDGGTAGIVWRGMVAELIGGRAVVSERDAHALVIIGSGSDIASR
jgi:hypothetical protein